MALHRQITYPQRIVSEYQKTPNITFTVIKEAHFEKHLPVLVVL